MAEMRMVNTMVWQDSYFQALDDGGKLVYLYLMTTPSVTYYGTLNALPEMIAAETGMDAEHIGRTLDTFEADGKILREAPYWITINYYPEHQGKRDADGKPDLGKVSRKALLANKYQMPKPIWRQTLSNWGIAESDVEDPPSNGGSDTPSNGGLDNIEDKREKGKGKRRKRKRGKRPAADTSSSFLAGWEHEELSALRLYPVGRFLLDLCDIEPDGLDVDRGEVLYQVCNTTIRPTEPNASNFLLSAHDALAVAKTINGWLLREYDKTLPDGGRPADWGNLTSKKFLGWLKRRLRQEDGETVAISFRHQLHVETQGVAKDDPPTPEWYSVWRTDIETDPAYLDAKDKAKLEDQAIRENRRRKEEEEVWDDGDSHEE